MDVPESTGTMKARASSKQRVIRNVIVADPNRSVASAVKRSLEMEFTYIVEIATSPDEILNLVKSKPYDLVVVFADTDAQQHAGERLLRGDAAR